MSKFFEEVKPLTRADNRLAMQTTVACKAIYREKGYEVLKATRTPKSLVVFAIDNAFSIFLRPSVTFF